MDSPELLRFAKLVKLLRWLQNRHAEGERSPTLLQQLDDATRHVDRSVAWIITNRQPATADHPSSALPRRPPA